MCKFHYTMYLSHYLVCYMTYAEFKRQLGKAALTTKEFAELIKHNGNSITNCSKIGEVPALLAIIAALMGEMADNHVNFKSVLSNIEFEPNKPRGKNFTGKSKKALIK